MFENSGAGVWYCGKHWREYSSDGICPDCAIAQDVLERRPDWREFLADMGGKGVSDSYIPSAALYGDKQPTLLGRTDFKTWDRETLEKFARTSADENKALREELAFALAAWRKEVLRNPTQAVSSDTPTLT